MPARASTGKGSTGKLLHWDFPRDIASTRILVGLGADYGLTPAQCLADSGIRQDELDGTGRLVEAGQELQVIRNLLRHLGNDLPLGLAAGERYHVTTYGIWGFAIMSSLTLRNTLEVAVRFVQLSSAFCKVRIEEADGNVLLIGDDDELPEDLRDFLVERDTRIVLNLQQAILPMPAPFTRFDQKRAAPAYAERIAALYGITPRWGQSLNCIGVSAALADMKLPQGDYSALRQMETACQKLLDSRKLRTGLSAQVRDMLMMNTRHMPVMDEVAEKFAVTPRTLRNRLAKEGSDYETLVEEVRRTLAEELLKTTGLTIEDIAARLGYSEHSCFTRAFKRWNGMAPQQYRKNRGSDGVA